MPVVQPKYNSRFEWKNLEDDYPLTSIRASQIECYLGWIRNKTGLQYRLPSEEEWVAIARSETGREVYRVAQASRQEGYLKNRLVFPTRSRMIYEGPCASGHLGKSLNINQRLRGYMTYSETPRSWFAGLNIEV
nr:SUMF1/EgtB/PvdO family nonheme iron enzyme [Sphingopyxis sp. BSNA05]